MNYKLSLTFILTSLLLAMWLVGCGADDELRYPGAPVVDVISEYENADWFTAGALASEYLPYTIGLKRRLTFRGYRMNPDRDPFESTVEEIVAMNKGRRYLSMRFRKDIFDFWDRHHGLELDRTGIKYGGAIGVVTSLTVEIYPYAYEDKSPIFNVGVGSVTMHSTLTPTFLR